VPAHCHPVPSGWILKWDGQSWSALPDPPYQVFDLAVFDEDGPGAGAPALFAAIKIPPGVVKWDGTSWLPLGAGLRSGNHTCSALEVCDLDGPGPQNPVLLAGGFFTLAGAVSAAYAAKWDGHEWSALGTGLPWQVDDFATVPNPAGPPAVYAATLANWRVPAGPHSNSWLRIGTATAPGPSGSPVLCRLAAFDDDGAGPQDPAIYYASLGITAINNTPS
jgi:hypothetical protein